MAATEAAFTQAEKDAITDAILSGIATSSRSLKSVLEEIGNPITPATLYRWVQLDDKLRDRYAQARQHQAQVLADEIAAIADETQEGIKTKVTERGTEITTADMIEHRKLRIDSRKWIASHLLPKVYGDRIALTDPSGEGPAVFLLERIGSAGKPQQ